MIVRCMKPFDYDRINLPEGIKNTITVGDDFLLGEVGVDYEVIGSGNLNGIECYELEGIDASSYGIKLLHRKDRFKVIDDAFVPNTYIKLEGAFEGAVRTHNFYISKQWELGDKN